MSALPDTFKPATELCGFYHLMIILVVCMYAPVCINLLQNESRI